MAYEAPNLSGPPTSQQLADLKALGIAYDVAKRLTYQQAESIIELRKNAATPAQVRYLMGLGMAEEAAQELTRDEATEEIRKRSNEPTPKQLAFIAQHEGIDVEEVKKRYTKAEATEKVGEIIRGLKAARK